MVVPGGRRSHQVLLVVSPGCYVYTHHIFHGRKLLRQRFILSGDMLLTATELDIDEKNERQTWLTGCIGVAHVAPMSAVRRVSRVASK